MKTQQHIFDLHKNSVRQKSYSWLWAMLAATPLPARGEVDLLTGGFSRIFWDSVGAPPSKAKHRRSYRSRSLHSGFFGFGWCSEFEKSITLRTPQELVLQDCDAPAEQLFTKNHNRFTTELDAEDKIYFVDGVYQRIQNSVHTQTFNQQGQLIEYYAPQMKITLEYSVDGKIYRLRFGPSEIMTWTWNKEKNKVIRIQKKSGESTNYEYQADDLARVTHSPSRDSEEYSYDKAHNLTQTPHETITYDSDRDIAISVRTQHNCTESYKYSSTTPLIQITDYKKTCDSPNMKSKEINKQFRFIFRSKSHNQVVLTHLELKTNNRTLHYTFKNNRVLPTASPFERRQRLGATHE